MRNREVAASGWLCLLENAPEDERYDPDREALKYSDADELITAAREAGSRWSSIP